MLFLRTAQRLGVTGGLSIALLAGLSYNLLLLFVPRHRGSLAVRLAFVAAILSFSLGWTVFSACVARERNWSSEECFRFTAFSLMAFGPINLLILSPFTPVPFADYTGFFACGPFFGSIARKIAFPQLKLGERENPSLTVLRLN